MTILQLQRRIQEAGRLRIGQQVPTGNGKTRPAKLETWRVTSADKARIEAIAELYGGTPRQWDAPAGSQWEVVTETDALPIIVPPSDLAFSQHMELWSAGGCQRRCDGVTEQIGDQPCVCDPDAPECSIHTRLSVMLRDVPGLGVYRLDTQGYYAAVELQGAIEIVQMAAARGTMIPARLRLEQRQTKRPGQGTRKFAVPVIDLEVSPAQLLGGHVSGAIGAGDGGGLAALPQAQPADEEPPALLTPVPPSMPERPAAPVADQAKAAGQVKGPKRAGASATIPSTGLKPRTAAQAEAGESPERGEPEGATPISGEDLEDLTVAQLKIRCKNAGLPVSGTKAELIERLMDADPELKHGPVDEAPPPPPDDDDGPRAAPSDQPASITPGQLQKLAILCRELGVRDGQDDTLYRAALNATYGVDTSKDLSEKQASGLIRVLENGRTGLDGQHQPPEAVAASWLQKGADWLEERERLGLRGRMFRAMQTIGSEHEAYAGLYERMVGLVGRRAGEDEWAAADEGKVGELVVEAERVAAEVDR